MLDEMRLASLLAKASTGDAAVLPAPTVLRMATLNGAAALGLDARIGSLVPGKDADLTAVQLADVETLPLYDPISQLVNAAGREHVTDVWVAGERVLEERRLTRVDVESLRSRTRMWQTRLA
jgi:5-methylthioadenosine/S-adenosylhomocysteine deaminase